jgi:cell division protein FtsA
MLDGQPGIRNPLGMHTSRLEVETHVITGASELVEKLTLAVEQAGLNVASLVLEPIASAEAVVTDEEKESGVALVDMGGGTTDLILYSQGTVFYNAALPVGGFQFTNDICVAYSTTYEAAEEAKLKFGNTEPAAVKASGELSLPIEGRTRHRQIALREMCQLMRERAQELVRLVRIKLHEAGQSENSELRLVLTGGASGLPGLDDMMRRTISRHVRIGVPDSVPDIPEELRAPKFATSVGILLWAIKAGASAQPAVQKNGSGFEVSPNGGMSKIFKKWLPG